MPKKLADLADKITITNAADEPLWKGPEVDGITQSLLNNWLSCRERARAHMIDGLAAQDAFVKAREYGSMFHTAAEYDQGGDTWKVALTKYTNKLIATYPLATAEIKKWYELCKLQYPVYTDYWEVHPEPSFQTIFNEHTFNVPYTLPSGRCVRLRGKWDVLQFGKSIESPRKTGVYIKDHKTKGQVDEQEVKNRLTFDLQTMFYLVSVYEAQKLGMYCFADKQWKSKPILGIRYNIVRRPLAGPRYTYHKPKLNETEAEWYARILQTFREDPTFYFIRFQADVGAEHVEAFKEQFLNPCLEQLCDWYEYLCNPTGINRIHYRTPYGIYNVIAEGGVSDFEEYINTGSLVGLTRIQTLFPELEPLDA